MYDIIQAVEITEPAAREKAAGFFMSAKLGGCGRCPERRVYRVTRFNSVRRRLLY